jgi:hypothetical protein
MDFGNHALEGEGDTFSQKKEAKEHLFTEATQLNKFQKALATKSQSSNANA